MGNVVKVLDWSASSYDRRTDYCSVHLSLIHSLLLPLDFSLSIVFTFSSGFSTTLSTLAFSFSPSSLEHQYINNGQTPNFNNALTPFLPLSLSLSVSLSVSLFRVGEVLMAVYGWTNATLLADRQLGGRAVLGFSQRSTLLHKPGTPGTMLD